MRQSRWIWTTCLPPLLLQSIVSRFSAATWILPWKNEIIRLSIKWLRTRKKFQSSLIWDKLQQLPRKMKISKSKKRNTSSQRWKNRKLKSSRVKLRKKSRRQSYKLRRRLKLRIKIWRLLHKRKRQHQKKRRFNMRSKKVLYSFWMTTSFRH